MGFLGDLAKSAAQGVQDRVNKVSEKKEEFERKYATAPDEELFRYMSRISPISEHYAALSLILQDRGYSTEEISNRCYEMKHNR